ncbi:hypothetical protein ABW19_dt0202716 [Dactylella cylindrospora]|nr:hypothetical protein ABW19_dt0202716 [Dactylella cylindrospora]
MKRLKFSQSLITRLTRPIERPRRTPIRLTPNRYCASCSTAPIDKSPPSAHTPPTPATTESASKTRHHALATQQELYTTSPFSPGSPLFLPHGARIFNKLIQFLRAQYALYGYEEVISPTIYKQALWQQSGHWENFQDDMFKVSGIKHGVVDVDTGGENEEASYGLKPMNCPGHCIMFKSINRSYSELPVRFADFSPLHRNEIQSALTGLTRVRRFHQDDAHIFCRPSQISQEIASTLSMIDVVYSVFSLHSYKFVLSTRPTNHIGTEEEWDRAETALKSCLTASGKAWTINEGDGAFYGPKIDIILTDSAGKEHQTATVQLDFQLPLRFGLNYLAPAPESEKLGIQSTNELELQTSGYVTPVIIHRAIFGSLERFMALLIEKYENHWPFWINPRQAIVIPITNTPEVLEYAKHVRGILSGTGSGEGSGGGSAEETNKRQPLGNRTFFVEVDEKRRGLRKSVSEGKRKGWYFIVAVGETDMKEGKVTFDEYINGKYERQPRIGAKELYGRFVELEREYS